jgi:hypothetical protein
MIFLLPEISGSYIPSLRMQSLDRFGFLLLCQERNIVISITVFVAVEPHIVIYISKPSFLNLCSLGKIVCKSAVSLIFLIFSKSYITLAECDLKASLWISFFLHWYLGWLPKLVSTQHLLTFNFVKLRVQNLRSIIPKRFYLYRLCLTIPRYLL